MRGYRPYLTKEGHIQFKDATGVDTDYLENFQWKTDDKGYVYYRKPTGPKKGYKGNKKRGYTGVDIHQFRPIKTKKDKTITFWTMFKLWMVMVGIVIALLFAVKLIADYNANFKFIGEGIKPNISPVTFTEQELRDFYGSREAQAAILDMNDPQVVVSYKDSING